MKKLKPTEGILAYLHRNTEPIPADKGIINADFDEIIGMYDLISVNPVIGIYIPIDKDINNLTQTDMYEILTNK